jgi:hypothetical protein
MRLAPLLAALALASPAAAQERELCADRPGLGAPPCIVDKGRVLVETGLAGWTRNDDGAVRADTLAIADSFVRIGVSDTVEAQIGWTPYARQRRRDRAGGGATTRDGVGDVLLGLKANLANPDGSGFSIAVQPGVTLPVGSDGIGAGDWSAALLVPLSYDLAGVSLQATPQVYAATDADGSGRHLAWGSVVGIGVDLGGSVGAGRRSGGRDDPGLRRPLHRLATG